MYPEWLILIKLLFLSNHNASSWSNNSPLNFCRTWLLTFCAFLFLKYRFHSSLDSAIFSSQMLEFRESVLASLVSLLKSSLEYQLSGQVDLVKSETGVAESNAALPKVLPSTSRQTKEEVVGT